MKNPFARSAVVAITLVCGIPVVGWTQVTPPETQPVLLQMVRDDAIHRALDLSDQQIQKVFAALEPIDGPWFRVRIRPVEERVTTIRELTEQLTEAITPVLGSDQLARLDQLHNQALGTRMIVRDKTSAKLGISQSKREELYKVFHDTDKTVADVQAKLQAKEMEPIAAARKIKQAKSDEKKAFVDSMTNEQRRKLSSLTGSAFNFSGVKRLYPAAPELGDEGIQWLQSSGIKLEDLKGKVVAVHFYVHHCINCKRNLPHYTGWHDDYADDGLVVIGIQSPEDFPGRRDKSGRDPERIVAEMKKYDIQYPIVLDSDLKIWKQWSNTMWPTVYLIDKKGFLRRWWQGEMNWKGNAGEKDMRKTIEQLLAEDA